jgi:hypothetical protein
MNTEISLNDAVAAMVAAPGITYCLRGSPGVGKTFKTRALLEYAGYDVTIVPCQNMPIEDTAMLPVKQDDGTIRFASNEMWRAKPGVKQAFILDELPKAPEDVFNALNGLLYGVPRTMQGFAYGPQTIVAVTSNPEQFGAGDLIRPHHVNRMCMFDIADPTLDDAERDMLDLNFHPSVIGWMKKTPQALCSYDAAAQDRPVGENVGYYGYLSTLPNRPFCSMRSLEGASRALHAGMPKPVLRTTLAGLIGFDAMSSFMMHYDEIGEVIPLPTILANPLKAPVPKQLFDQRYQALACAAALTEENAMALFDYTQRLKPDVFRQVFLTSVVKKRVWSTQLAVIPKLNDLYRAALK